MIRKATADDIEDVLRIYEDAREYMARVGNPDQWGNNYPSRELLESDVDAGNLYVLVEEKILASFVFFIGNDKTYEKIYSGQWLNDAPYGVIHRIAISDSARGRGVSRACFDYAYSLINNIKIDTHKDNLPMQRALEKYGFQYCGIIYIESGDERIAFQKV